MIYNLDSPPYPSAQEEYIVGIDPGDNGMVIFTSKSGDSFRYSCSDFYSEKGLFGFSKALHLSGVSGDNIFMENVHGIPGEKGSGSFNENIGLIKGVMVAHRLHFRLVTPQVWQRAFGLGGQMPYGDRKRLQAEKAGELFPKFKKTNGGPVPLKYADALLITAYGMLEHGWEIKSKGEKP